MWFFYAVRKARFLVFRVEIFASFARFGLTAPRHLSMEPQLPKQAGGEQARLSGRKVMSQGSKKNR
jgi:hypothetical protein